MIGSLSKNKEYNQTELSNSIGYLFEENNDQDLHVAEEDMDYNSRTHFTNNN